MPTSRTPISSRGTQDRENFSPARLVIDRAMARYVRRRRWVAAARAAGFAFAAVAGWYLAACLLDRYLPFNRPVRVATDGTAALMAVVLLRPAGRLLRRRFDPVAAAVAVEAQLPDLAGRLTTVVSTQVNGTSPYMLAVITDQVAGELPRRIRVSVRPVAVPLAASLAATAAVLATFHTPRLDMPGLTRRLLHPLTVLPPVTATHLLVSPTPPSVPVGQPLRIACTATPVDPATVTVHVSDDAGRTWTAWPMTPDANPPGRFSYTWAAVDRDLRFYVSAGDATGPATAVAASAKPVIVEFRTRIEPPKYLHRPVTTATGGDAVIDAVDGSAVTVDVVCSRPLWRLRASAGGHDLEIAPTADPAVVRYPLVVRGDQKIELRPIGADGQAGEPRTIEVRGQPDRPPTVRFLDPTEVSLVGPDWKVDGGYEAGDDFGLASVTTDLRVDDRRPVPTERKLGNTLKNAIVEDAIDLKPLGLVSGDVVTVHVRAKDGREPNPQVASTEAHHFLVVPEPGDPNDGKRLADLVAASEWIDRVGTDPAAAAELRVCLERAEFHAPSPQYAGFIAGLMNRPPESARADVRTLLDGERASELVRLKAALAWIDGRAEPERNGSARKLARDRLSAHIEAESLKLGIATGASEVRNRLRDFELAEAALLQARPQVPPPTVPPARAVSPPPAITAARPPELPPSRPEPENDVPGYEEAVRLYLARLKPTPPK